jgi:hypothetical protein
MGLFAGACSTAQKVEDTIFADGPRGAVSLQSVEDSWFKTAHPVSVSPLMVTHVLRGVQIQALPDDKTTAGRVFSDEDTEYLSPLISTALSKATKSQLVAFRVLRGRGAEHETIGGVLYLQGRLLHLALTHYRANSDGSKSGEQLDRPSRHPSGLGPRQLGFVPEAVKRSNLNEQPDLLDPPPLATLVIDYKLLLAELELSSGSVQPQTTHGPTPDRIRGDASSALSNAGGTASQETPALPKEKTQALQELIREQAIELDALKEDMRTLRRRLSEMETERHNQTK